MHHRRGPRALRPSSQSAHPGRGYVLNEELRHTEGGLRLPYGGRLVAIFRRLHGVPGRVKTDQTVERARDLEWLANTFVWERGFAWRQSSLRILQLQLLGVSAYSISLVIAGFRVYGMAALLCTSAWSLLHSWLQTKDMRRCRESRDTNAVLTGLHAVGGFGGLPAPYARLLLTGTTSDEQDDSDLRRLGVEWSGRHLRDRDLRETFLLLAGEFDGTADELLDTSETLLNT